MFKHEFTNRLHVRHPLAVGLALAMTVATTAVVTAVVASDPGPMTGCLAAKTTPGSGATKGQIYNIAQSETTPLAPCVKGDSQVVFSNAKGPQGIQGIQGDQGIQGIQGDQGVQGIQGDQGMQGPKGDTGQSGINGYQVVTVTNSRPMAITAMTATCPAGKVVVGGVYALQEGDTILGLSPTTNGLSTWLLKTGPSTFARQLWVYCINQ